MGVVNGRERLSLMMDLKCRWTMLYSGDVLLPETSNQRVGSGRANISRVLAYPVGKLQAAYYPVRHAVGMTFRASPDPRDDKIRQHVRRE